MVKVWFEKYYAFRRGVILLELAMFWWVTQLTFEYILYATGAGVPASDIVPVATILQAPPMAVLAYSFKLYSKDRSNVPTNS